MRPIRRLAPVVANVLGGMPIPYADLSREQRARFDAQLSAWRAACDLGLVSHLNVAYGVPVPSDAVAAWATARDEWEFRCG